SSPQHGLDWRDLGGVDLPLVAFRVFDHEVITIDGGNDSASSLSVFILELDLLTGFQLTLLAALLALLGLFLFLVLVILVLVILVFVIILLVLILIFVLVLGLLALLALLGLLLFLVLILILIFV